jgi:hypothetical protein
MASGQGSPGDPPGDDEIMREMFGRKRGGVPKDVREQLRFASDAINAHERGMSVPEVALNYRFEPIQAMTTIAICCQDYGYESVAPWVPKHVMSLVQAKYPDNPALQPSPRPPKGKCK